MTKSKSYKEREAYACNVCGGVSDALGTVEHSLVCTPEADFKVADITNHKLSDKNILIESIDDESFWFDIQIYQDRATFHMNKLDVIFLAKEMGVTAGDLK